MIWMKHLQREVMHGNITEAKESANRLYVLSEVAA
jgi:hypothetical protein